MNKILILWTHETSSGRTLEEVLKENTVEATEKSLVQLKYQPESVRGYVEVCEFCCLSLNIGSVLSLNIGSVC